MLAYLSRYTHRVAISNRRLLAFDERGVTFRWKDYRATGKTRYKTMTLGADEFMRRFLLHVLPSGFHRIRHYGLLANAGRREHLAQARELLHVVPATVERDSRSAGRHHRAYLRLPALRCRDEHRRDLRSRPTDSRTAHVASCRMSTGIGCVNDTSALRRPPPIADGFALRGQNRTSRPLRHHRIRPRIIAIPHRCDVSRRFSDRLGAIAPARGPSNPHSRLASPNDSGACRGFLPRGLYDACPRRVVTSSHACASGQASHNP